MKLVNRCFLLVCLWLTAGALRVHGQCVTAPNDPGAFLAIDDNGLTVQSFCVGQRVRFEPISSRNIPSTLLRYGVLPGVGTTFSSMGCAPPFSQPYFYTPTRAEVGMVTVSELATPPSGIGGTYYIRTFQVFDNPAPTFTIASCPSGTALVTLTATSPYDSYTVQAGSGASLPIIPNVPQVVNTAGTTSITVTGHYTANGSCEGVNTQPLPSVAAPVNPSFTQLQLQAPLPGGAATLSVGNLPAGYVYTLQSDTGSGFVDVANIPAGSTTVNVPTAAAGCYRVFRKDFCGTSPDSTLSICTLSLTGTSSQNRNQLLLSDRGAPNTTYTVLRNGSAYTTFTAIRGVLEDANVQCGTTYTYTVTATQPGGAAISNSVSITTVSLLPPPRPALLASFNLRNVVELTTLTPTPLPTGSSLSYRRSAGGAAPVNFGTATTGRLIRDSTALASLMAQPPCYSVSLTDVCGNVSPESSTACPALLTASAADPEGTTTLLSWTPFSGPDPGVPAVYSLERLSTTGTVLSTLALSGNSFTDLTPPQDQQVLRYRLKVGGAGLPVGVFSYSNLATVRRQLFLNVPTAFTPNGDGLNDVLEIKGKYLRDYTFVVVDRNGQEVFRGTQRSDAWDGTIKGHAPVNGSYVWSFRQDGEDGTSFKATGAVTILK
ncbi:MAG: hypothetical protein JWR44_2741 [Hymenobacter sp.]|nr:hypothetical protein [Hymenobacter sp.]